MFISVQLGIQDRHAYHNIIFYYTWAAGKEKSDCPRMSASTCHDPRSAICSQHFRSFTILYSGPKGHPFFQIIVSTSLFTTQKSYSFVTHKQQPKAPCTLDLKKKKCQFLWQKKKTIHIKHFLYTVQTSYGEFCVFSARKLQSEKKQKGFLFPASEC